jgi:hypothetical protein
LLASFPQSYPQLQNFHHVFTSFISRYESLIPRGSSGHAPTLQEETLKKLFCNTIVVAGLLLVTSVAHAQPGPIRWTRNGAPAETYVIGGPWTLEQSGAAVGLKSAGYCDGNGNQVPNPGIQRMQPYYFPFITGHGEHLQGYFDYRPKDIDEAVAAASSDDAGHTWTFQQKVLELRTTCPTQLQKDPDGDKDNANDGNNDDNGDDDGQGHQFILKIKGHTYLYTLERAAGHIDSDDLYIHDLTPLPGLPLNGAPAMNDGPTDASPSTQGEIASHTYGLLNPDGILGVVPGVSPVTIIYEQKILNGDNTGPTALPKSQQCNTYWAPYYNTNPFGTSVNDDITYLRLAQTTDGVHFTDLGALQGLNNIADVTANGTRWLATAGTVLKLHGGRYGLLFSGGGCIDGDSDAFHYIGYAESTDLLHWNVINGINNAIVETAPYTIYVDANNLPVPNGTPGGTPLTVPTNVPVTGGTMGWYQGRVYAPSATLSGHNDLTVFFAGYHTPKPKNGLGDYRTIGRVSIHSNQFIESASTSTDSDEGEDNQ